MQNKKNYVLPETFLLKNDCSIMNLGEFYNGGRGTERKTIVLLVLEGTEGCCTTHIGSSTSSTRSENRPNLRFDFDPKIAIFVSFGRTRK